MTSEKKQKLEPHHLIQLPAMLIPGYRSSLAIQNGVERKLLFKTYGGLGDQICAEPTLRYALENFNGYEIYLASESPSLFSHLKFTGIFNLKEVTPVYSNYFVFDTITPPDDSNLVWQFFSHMLTHCVDFPSMCALRLQLPVSQKEVRLPDLHPSIVTSSECFPSSEHVVVHAGRHWPSKTFPKDWWDIVLKTIVEHGKIPVLIGADTDDNRGTVDVDVEGCIDLRNQMSIMETISFLKRSQVLLTNDSSPLHMAVDSDCWIGFCATAKHPDFITHWRKGQWGWRMRNFTSSNMFETTDMCPNKAQEVAADKLSEDTLREWLPNPKDFALWGISKLE